MQGRGSGKVRDFALYGETTGETDEFGLPVRWNWAAEYRGRAIVVYGHTPGARAGVAEPHDQHRHRLRLRRHADGAALPGAGARRASPRRRPTPSRRGRSCPRTRQRRAADHAAARGRAARHRRRARQADHRDAAARERHDPRGERDRGARGDEPLRHQPEVADLPAADDVSRRRRASEPGLLEHPAEAFAYYRHEGVPRGRLRGEAHGLARGRGRLPRRGRRRAARFGVVGEGLGVCYTRTGRRFFDDHALEAAAPRPGRATRVDDGRAVRASSAPTGSASTAS